MGAGHQARCLAIAQAWTARHGTATLVADVVPDTWAARFHAAGVDQVRPGQAGPVHWWVVDGYGLSAHEPDAPHARRRGRIDDHALSPLEKVDLTLDQNLRAEAGAYGTDAGALLLGPRYALLRQDLVDRIGARRTRFGADGDRTGPPTLVVLGGGAPAPALRRWLAAVVSELEGAVLPVVLDGTGDTGAALAEADLALSTSGSTAWELCALGVPSVLVSAAPNQEPLGRALGDAGAALDLGPFEVVDPARAASAVRGLIAAPAVRQELVARAKHVVDGRGAARVATHLRSLLVSLRPAEANDADRIHRWNDHPDVRAASFRTESIPWEDHLAWFDTRRSDPATPIWVASDSSGDELGVVRFTIDGPVAEIGVALAPERRGQGWGAAMIGAGCAATLECGGVRTIVAQVKEANAASRRAFLDADFDLATPPRNDGVLWYCRGDARP